MLPDMRFSRLLAPTLRDDPADAEVVSHKLLLRAGFIRRVTSGVYDFLPLGLRVLRNIEAIVREEMNRAGAQELLMPMVQPAELWQKSGRWEKYGPELLRFQDRHDHESCLGPTHEEVICDLVSRELRSYKQLPMNLYQIQSKFRDEIRPRFGLMRGREFIMKDGYSFHVDDDCLNREYENMFAAYQKIFTRIGLKFRAVEADTGNIGGSASHEFHVLADSGEDLIVHCDTCDYAANVEKAESKRVDIAGAAAELLEVNTPGETSVQDVADLLKIDTGLLVKTMMMVCTGGAHDGAVVAACVPGNDTLQPIKLARYLGADEIRMATEDEIETVGGIVGYVGPIGLTCPVVIDHSLQNAVGLVAGANKKDMHVAGLDVQRDMGGDARFADLRQVQAGDTCAKCDGTMALSRGIEVGHVFQLGRQYAEPMDVVFQDRNGKRAVATMGCYGIGVSRLMAAIVEQCHDENGIVWPAHMSPFQCVLVSIGKSEALIQAADDLYQKLRTLGVDVVWDDRAERPGVKFRDAELIGIPHRLVISERGFEAGKLEYKPRQGDVQDVALDQIDTFVNSMA